MPTEEEQAAADDAAERGAQEGLAAGGVPDGSAKKPREPRDYLVLIETTGDSASVESYTLVNSGKPFSAFRREEALQDAIELLGGDYDGEYLVAVTASSWKPMKATVEEVVETKTSFSE